MSLLLAPYNNGMRIGQGFNSFTQQICVDNAVVIDPERAENVITNDGTTMRVLVQKMKKASVWRQMTEYVNNGEPVDPENSTEPSPDAHPDAASGATGAADEPEYEEDDEEEEEDRQRQLERDQAERDANLFKIGADKKATADAAASAAPQAERTLASEDRTGELTEAQADEALKNDADQTAAANKKLSDDREAGIKADEKKMMETADAKLELMKKEKERNERMAGRQTGMGSNKGKKLAWSMQKSIGTSQIVSYSSRFVDKLSEISEDMSGSAALSIKSGSFGGSGSGAFINTEKFYSSDIKFYLSVKVINQSINFKDALEYNPIRSVSEANAERFNTVFGDSFISGFLEGGELNAVVLIKVLNEAKKKDIMAEAAVALTKGIELKGQGNIALAKKNIQMNTEVSINVRWCGGASIKSYNEAWTIDSLMAAANRFPYLVSQFPQRTYAILTKYESLRSFVKLKPAKLSPLKYENATLYGNMLQDAFFEYTALQKRVSSDIRAVQAGVKRFKAEVPLASTEGQFQSASLQKSKLTKFAASLEGLDAARVAIRAQMNAIVREIDAITKDPNLATKDREIVYVGPASFQTLIPPVEYKVRKIRGAPLSGQRINDEVKDVEKAIQAKNDSLEVHLFDQSQTVLPLSEMEQIKVADLERDNPELAEVTRVTPPVGSLSTGTPFCTLDLGLQDPVITEINVGQLTGVVRSLSITYSNGLTSDMGDDIDEYQSYEDGEAVPETAKVRKTLGDLSASELIVSASVQVDAAENEQTISVVGLTFVTNKGRILDALSTVKGVKGHSKTYNFEKPLTDGAITGAWGRHRTAEDVANEEAVSKAVDVAKDAEEVQENRVQLSAGPVVVEAQGTPRQTGRITRLGFVWTQAIVKEALFDDESPVECQTSPTLRTSSGVVRFGRRYPEIPQLIWGTRDLILDGGLAPSFSAAKKFVVASDLAGQESYTPDALACTIETSRCKPSLQWMVLPELEDIHIQCGEVKIVTEGHEQIRDVAFDLSFDEGKVPEIIVWIVDFSNGPSERVDIQVGVNNAGSASATSFELKVSSSAGSFDAAAASGEKLDVLYSEITVGWLAHDKIASSSPADSIFRSGKIETSIGPKGEDVAAISFGADTPFPAKPTKLFFALSAIKAEGSGQASWSIKSTGVTALGMKPTISAPANSTYKAVWVASQ